MSINYHLKKFKVEKNSDAGELEAGLIFEYHQEGRILTCSYSGGNITKGHILGTVNPETGVLDFVYHQINTKGELCSGKCHSRPELLPSGKIRLYESWEWTSGKNGKGTSTLIEL